MTAPAQHSAVVRITHWINAGSFLALVVSGCAVLISHPRFYWGETGALGAPALFELPLPLILAGQNGWGRYLHFQSAWITVITGMIYVLSTLATGRAPAHAQSYSAMQRAAYRVVIFLLLPFAAWSGLAMSPAVTAVFPVLVTSLGGTQSARTLHFFASCTLFLFFLGHILMVIRSGFRRLMRAMITGEAQ